MDVAAPGDPCCLVLMAWGYPVMPLEKFTISTTGYCDTSAIDRWDLEIIPFDAFFLVGFRQKTVLPPLSVVSIYAASMHPEPLAMALASFFSQPDNRKYVRPLLEKMKICCLVKSYELKEVLA